MLQKCLDCPFQSSGPGLRQRRALHKRRWQEILAGLRAEAYFMCHKTTTETGDGTNKVCAGAIEWQDKRGISSNYVRVCERLDYFSSNRAQRGAPTRGKGKR